MLIRNRDIQKITICLLLPVFLAVFIILPDSAPLAILAEILVVIVFLEFVCAVSVNAQPFVCAEFRFEVRPRSPPVF